MKRNIAIIVAVIVLTVTGTAFALGNDQGKETRGCKCGMKGDKGMKGKEGMMGGGMMKMMGMMQQMHSNLVATPDGGVIVSSGGKLIKYDNQLNVVKQIDLPKPEMGMMDMDNDDKGLEAKKPTEDHAAHH